MEDLQAETIRALCVSHHCRGYFTGQDDLIGVRHQGRILWFRWFPPNCYSQTGSTDTPQGATYHRL